MADAKNDIVLSIRGMSKSFGRNRVLDHIDLDVRRGTVMGLMGENGAGKSTMMKCLFGTYQKDEGKIFLNGKEISFSGPKDALENGIAMVHQELPQGVQAVELQQAPGGEVGHDDDGEDDLVGGEAQNEGQEDHPVHPQQPGHDQGQGDDEDEAPEDGHQEAGTGLFQTGEEHRRDDVEAGEEEGQEVQLQAPDGDLLEGGVPLPVEGGHDGPA